jgi:hypothetical protein
MTSIVTSFCTWMSGILLPYLILAAQKLFASHRSKYKPPVTGSPLWMYAGFTTCCIEEMIRAGNHMELSKACAILLGFAMAIAAALQPYISHLICATVMALITSLALETVYLCCPTVKKLIVDFAKKVGRIERYKERLEEARKRETDRAKREERRRMFLLKSITFGRDYMVDYRNLYALL